MANPPKVKVKKRHPLSSDITSDVLQGSLSAVTVPKTPASGQESGEAEDIPMTKTKMDAWDTLRNFRIGLKNFKIDLDTTPFYCLNDALDEALWTRCGTRLVFSHSGAGTSQDRTCVVRRFDRTTGYTHTICGNEEVEMELEEFKKTNEEYGVTWEIFHVGTDKDAVISKVIISVDFFDLEERAIFDEVLNGLMVSLRDREYDWPNI
ncbi:hypothetical protein FA15DRAFT_708448 [Coprinopsis marcescibilis]|uniref:Uncharacterized protein n=1 Tax=Coprinopsis marcescibilis TaxID=230819 RepID=A0A5C3KJC8_COPMA|nr:hypothetical protein FA15DRAFT_708448 [Coprinopsis marcescibilis]